MAFAFGVGCCCDFDCFQYDYTGPGAFGGYTDGDFTPDDSGTIVNQTTGSGSGLFISPDAYLRSTAIHNSIHLTINFADQQIIPSVGPVENVEGLPVGDTVIVKVATTNGTNGIHVQYTRNTLEEYQITISVNGTVLLDTPRIIYHPSVSEGILQSFIGQLIICYDPDAQYLRVQDTSLNKFDDPFVIEAGGAVQPVSEGYAFENVVSGGKLWGFEYISSDEDNRLIIKEIEAYSVDEDRTAELCETCDEICWKSKTSSFVGTIASTSEKNSFQGSSLDIYPTGSNYTSFTDLSTDGIIRTWTNSNGVGNGVFGGLEFRTTGTVTLDSDTFPLISIFLQVGKDNAVESELLVAYAIMADHIFDGFGPRFVFYDESGNFDFPLKVSGGTFSSVNTGTNIKVEVEVSTAGLVRAQAITIDAVTSGGFGGGISFVPWSFMTGTVSGTANNNLCYGQNQLSSGILNTSRRLMNYTNRSPIKDTQCITFDAQSVLSPSVPMTHPGTNWTP
jgi:hypothetical protein